MTKLQSGYLIGPPIGLFLMDKAGRGVIASGA
jgi:hypothetical protein